jgi:hypothetical protein
MKSFKNYIEEAHSEWHVTFKTGHKPQRVKGRNTAEAIKKAEKRAQKSGEKDPRQLAMYKDIKKVSEEVELDEAMSLRDIKNKKEREEKRKKEYGDETQHQRIKRKVYGNMMGGLKKEEAELDEVLDTPKAMQSYKNKAKASYSKAASSAAAKILRGPDKDGNRADHRPELKTMAKRKKGMTAADMVAVRRTFDNLRKEDITEADIAEILRQYALSENVNADKLAELTEEEINEIIGKALGGAFKLGAKATVGAARLAKKGAKAASSQGRIEREKKKLAREKEKLAKAKASRSMFSKQGRENRAKDRAELQKLRNQRKDLAAKRKSGNLS